jgi:predicted MFS family arabinose efflux permease
VLRRLLGDEVDPVLRPLLATTVLGFGGVFSFITFFALWASTELQAPKGELGLALAAGGIAGVAGSFTGGQLSDRVGRRRVIVAGAATQSVASAALLVPGLGRPGAYVTLGVLSFSQPLRGATQRALAADLAPSDAVERWLATLRIAVNTGATLGPLFGSLLVGAGWTSLHLGTTAAFVLSLITALRLAESQSTATEPPASHGYRDVMLALVLLSAVLSFIVYEAFQTLLPVSLAHSRGIGPATWGLLFAINPVLIVLLQLRVTRVAASVSLQAKIVVALALLGLPYLGLTVTTSLVLVGAIVTASALGEMLLIPASETLAVEIAPRGRRGAYLGAATAGNWLGTALAPAIGLQLAAAFGDDVMWIFVTLTACAAAASYLALAARRDRVRREAGATVTPIEPPPSHEPLRQADS